MRGAKRSNGTLAPFFDGWGMTIKTFTAHDIEVELIRLVLAYEAGRCTGKDFAKALSRLSNTISKWCDDHLEQDAAKAFMIERKIPGGEVMHRLQAKTHRIERYLRGWTYELMDANKHGRRIDEAALPSIHNLKGAEDHASRLHRWPNTVEYLAQFDVVE